MRVCLLIVVLLKVVLVDNSEGLLECTRVYGNLSRHPAVRKILTDNKGTLMLSVEYVQYYSFCFFLYVYHTLLSPSHNTLTPLTP